MQILVYYLLACYLLGAVPSGYLLARYWKGVDLRKVGSGNIGATNVLRNLGWGAGVVVLLLDMAKGLLAVLLWTGPFVHRLGMPRVDWVPALGGLVAVLGHDYTLFLGFKGGRGVATSAGVFLALAPCSTLTALFIFCVCVWATRMVSVGSLMASLALPPLLIFYTEAGRAGGRGEPVFWLALALAAFIWIKHIPNIRRILAGTENRLGGGKTPSEEKHA